MWMAGGGIKGGRVVGATDAIGLDQERLTYLHLGRHERLTLLKGRVIKEII